MGSNPRVGSKKCDRTQKYNPYPPAIETSREVANLTEKNTHTLVYGVKEFVRLSVCLSVCLR